MELQRRGQAGRVGDRIALPQVEKRLRDFGGEPASSTPEKITEKVKSEIARWTRVIADAGIPRQ